MKRFLFPATFYKINRHAMFDRSLTGPVCMYHAVRAPIEPLPSARRGPSVLSQITGRVPCVQYVTPMRWQSSALNSADYVPAPPVPTAPDSFSLDAIQVIPEVNSLGEASLTSLGLGGWSPSGMMQHYFELLHSTAGLPWWGAIAVGTLVLRLCVFPLVIKGHKNSVKMANSIPEMTALQAKVNDAKTRGNSMEVAINTQKMLMFMQERDLNPLKNFLVPMIQAPIFISVFFGLRKLANFPLVAMVSGGALWFVDLTLPDPYCILPVITSLTMLATIEMGVDGITPESTANSNYIRYFLRAMPFVVFPFAINFPAAILCYWTTSNTVGLVQISLLKVPAIRKYFNIPDKIKHAPENLPKKRPFVQGMKDDWSNMKVTQKLENRQRYDETRFQKAGLGPIVKTYKHDPTKQNSPQL